MKIEIESKKKKTEKKEYCLLALTKSSFSLIFGTKCGYSPIISLNATCSQSKRKLSKCMLNFNTEIIINTYTTWSVALSPLEVSDGALVHQSSQIVPISYWTRRLGIFLPDFGGSHRLNWICLLFPFYPFKTNSDINVGPSCSSLWAGQWFS